MKSIYKILLATALVAIGCEDSDLPIDEINSNITRGVALRTVNLVSNEYTEFDTTGTFEVELEVQDSYGEVTEMAVYGSFTDNNDDGTDNSTGEILIETIPISDFETSQYDLPTIVYTKTYAELLTDLGLSESQTLRQDSFRIRFELVLEDGRTFSYANNSGTLTGTFYSSPFRYDIPIVCAPVAPTAGTWTIDMQDSYGDGWNGGYIIVALDGVETTYTLDSGSADSVTFEAAAGTSVISIKWSAGSWDSEVTFQVTSANGDVVLDEGPSPAAGSELFDYCTAVL